jgi:hypothetical protein
MSNPTLFGRNINRCICIGRGQWRLVRLLLIV